jgi:hypothetical protein
MQLVLGRDLVLTNENPWPPKVYILLVEKKEKSTSKSVTKRQREVSLWNVTEQAGGRGRARGQGDIRERLE